MLDLNARVSFDENKGRRAGQAASAADQKLEGSQVAESSDSSETERRVGEGLAHVRLEEGRGCDFNELLATTLQTAVALEEVHDRAARIAGDLHLDMPRSFDRLFDIERSFPKCGNALRAAARVGFVELGPVAGEPDAAAAAARERLDHDRRAFPERCQEGVRFSQFRHAVGSGCHRNAVIASQNPRLGLIAEEL